VRDLLFFCAYLSYLCYYYCYVLYRYYDVTGAMVVSSSTRTGGGVEISKVCPERGSAMQWPGY
jgi:hypothetical protein